MLGSLLVGAVSGVVSSNGEEDTGEHLGNEEQGGRPGGVVLRREQVMRVLFDGKTGAIEEEAVAGECFCCPFFIATEFACNYGSFPHLFLSFSSTSR